MAVRRRAAQQALALVVAGMDDDPNEPLCAQLLAEVEDIALVVSSLVGMCTGLLHCMDESRPGTSVGFFHGIGLSLEKMTEGQG
jgi:hypothetical protein